VTFRKVGIDEGLRLRESGHVVVDVREPVEWNAGHVPGALHIPLGELPARIGTDLSDRDAGILLYCRSGARSGRAAEFLVAHGYSNVANLDALITDWAPRGGAWEAPAPKLSAAHERRYARQLRLPDVGPEGQLRLLDAEVLVVGAGGLGSPAALYLAAAGIGTIGLADDDVVDESNLHRQVLHGADRIGMRKVDSAAMTLRGVNPDLVVRAHPERLGSHNADRLIGAYDLVVDGTDNLDARYAINDAAVPLRVPMVHASVYRWEAQVTTIVPFEGPCYRCMHPVQPPAEMTPDCDVAGVMGVVPGIAGLLQASEAIKLILGIGEGLAGRVIAYDALAMRFEEMHVERDPACAACGTGAPSSVRASTGAPSG
jgi:molybdopterin/thiamine biosynthesis adenylyltransferase/rhodanese-related sulfurtransferase